MEFPCSFCGYDVKLPDDFIPKNVGGVKVEKFDEESGTMLVVSETVVLQCRLCRNQAMVGAKAVKAKGMTREHEAKAK